MTRIEGVPRNTANPLVRAAYRTTRRQFGRMIDPVTLYAHSPRLLSGYGMFERATAKLHRVDERVKLLAELKAGTLVRCEFCIDIGSSLAHEAGITEEQMLALPRHRDSDQFSELEKLVLDYAAAISRTPVDVPDELFAALRANFDERQLLELTNVIALENMRARFNTAFGVTPAGFSEGMACATPEPALAAPPVQAA
jgi:AhpD family alkylhydroperoxidase